MSLYQTGSVSKNLSEEHSKDTKTKSRDIFIMSLLLIFNKYLLTSGLIYSLIVPNQTTSPSHYYLIDGTLAFQIIWLFKKMCCLVYFDIYDW